MYYENSTQKTDPIYIWDPIGSLSTPQVWTAIYSHDHNHHQINDGDGDGQMMTSKLSVKAVPRRRTLLRTPEGSHQTTLHHVLQAV